MGNFLRDRSCASIPLQGFLSERGACEVWRLISTLDLCRYAASLISQSDCSAVKCETSLSSNWLTCRELAFPPLRTENLRTEKRFESRAPVTR